MADSLYNLNDVCVVCRVSRKESAGSVRFEGDLHQRPCRSEGGDRRQLVTISRTIFRPDYKARPF